MILLLPFMMQFESFACCMTLEYIFLLVFPTGSYGITLVIDLLLALLFSALLSEALLSNLVVLLQTLVGGKRCVLCIFKLYSTQCGAPQLL